VSGPAAGLLEVVIPPVGLWTEVGVTRVVVNVGAMMRKRGENCCLDIRIPFM